MADTSNLSNFLGDVAEAIRTKREITDKIPAEQFDSEILKIETGIDTSDATATADNLEIDKTAYVNNTKITGTLGKLMTINRTARGIAAENENLNMTALIRNPDTAYFPAVGQLDSNAYQMIFSIDGAYYMITSNKQCNYQDYSSYEVLWNGGNLTAYQLINGTWMQNRIPNITFERSNSVVRIDNVRFVSIIVGSNYNIMYTADLSSVFYPQNTDLQPKNSIITPDTMLSISATNSDVANSIGLTADKLVKGNIVLGIEGTAEAGGSSGDIPVKLFETIEEMQADTTAEEGDLALVYRDEIQNATANSQFQTAQCPSTVVLPQAVTDYIDVRYRAVDSSVMFDCWGNLDSSRFMMDCYTDNGSVRIEYESSDGITYTRTDGGEEIVDFGTTIYYEYPDYWNDAIGYFIQCGGKYFEGLYNYKTFTYNDDEIVRVKKFSDMDNTILIEKPNVVQPAEMEDTEYRYEHILIHEIEEAYSLKNGEKVYKATDYDVIYGNNGSGNLLPITFYADTNDKVYATFQIPPSTNPAFNNDFYKQHYSNGVLDEDTKYNRKNITVPTIYVAYQGNYKSYTISSWGTFENAYMICYQGYGTTGVSLYTQTVQKFTKSIPFDASSSQTREYYNMKGELVDDIKYLLAPSQLTLKTSAELSPGIIAYGKKGVIKGDGSIYDNLDSSIMLQNVFGINKLTDNLYGDEYTTYTGTISTSNKLSYLKKDIDGEYAIVKWNNLHYGNDTTYGGYRYYFNNTKYVKLEDSTLNMSVVNNGEIVYTTDGISTRYFNENIFLYQPTYNSPEIYAITSDNDEPVLIYNIGTNWTTVFFRTAHYENRILMSVCARKSSSHRNVCLLINAETLEIKTLFDETISSSYDSSAVRFFRGESNIYIMNTMSNGRSIYKLNYTTETITKTLSATTTEIIPSSYISSEGYDWCIEDGEYIYTYDYNPTKLYGINVNTAQKYITVSNNTCEVVGYPFRNRFNELYFIHRGTDAYVFTKINVTKNTDGTFSFTTNGSSMLLNLKSVIRTSGTTSYGGMYTAENATSYSSYIQAIYQEAVIDGNSLYYKLSGPVSAELLSSRYRLSNSSDYDIICINGSLDSYKGNYLTVFNKNISDEEYNTAVDTANEILGNEGE